MQFWNTIVSEIKNGYNLVLLYVIESKGSSPGRQGFKMAVSQSGLLVGSIGGGIMEHKLVELCKSELLQAPFSPFIKKQVHLADIPSNKSGMICSGEQTIAFYHLPSAELNLIQQIKLAYQPAHTSQLSFSNQGIELENLTIESKFELSIANSNDWVLKENIHHAPQLHIIGGGHVSLALSKFAKDIGFNVTVYDDRTNLNTIAQNNFAKTCGIAEYKNISNMITQGSSSYVAIMSFGYKTDKIILKSLLKGSYNYLGMMGSYAKIDTLFKELMEEGTTSKELKTVFAPIGLPITSKTPQEIAVSILGQLIQIKNRK